MTNTIVSEAEKAGVDVLAGLANIFGNVKTSIASSAAVAGSTGTAAAAPSVAQASGTLGQAESAIAEIEALVADISAKKWTAAPGDVVNLLTTFMAILTKFGINVPFLSEIVGVLPTLAAIV